MTIRNSVEIVCGMHSVDGFHVDMINDKHVQPKNKKDIKHHEILWSLLALVLLVHEEPARDTPQRKDDSRPGEEHHAAVQRRRPVDEVRVRDGAADGAEGVAQRAEGGDEAVEGAWQVGEVGDVDEVGDSSST